MHLFRTRGKKILEIGVEIGIEVGFEEEREDR